MKLPFNTQELHTVSGSVADDMHIVRGYAEQIATQETFRLGFDMDKSNGKLLMANSSVVDRRAVVDVSWLPAAAEAYCLSADIKDYVIAEVPIVEGDIPNRNMHCFLTSRLVEFLPKFGVQAYKTFVGKPTFYEHQHEDNTKAKGVILDASMREVNGRWYTFILKAFDRTKDSALANDILSGKRKGHSMSAWTAAFNCSFCGHLWDTSYVGACDHVKAAANGQRVPGRFLGMGKVEDARLVYAITNQFYFFESSSVGDPANYGAFQTQQTTAPTL
jgi:hypothetical protein